ncbi:ATP-binding cassette domain-containing protein [Streptococcus ruminantium]|nr:ABC transporter ATP-binding protein [Streptococcus ruminantium]
MRLTQYFNYRYIGAALFFALLTGLDTLVIPVMVSGIIENIQSGDLQGLLKVCLYGMSGYILLKGTYCLWQVFNDKALIYFSEKVKLAVFKRTFTSRQVTETIQNMLYHDIATLQSDYLDSWIKLIYCIWFSAVSAIYIFTISWQVSSIFIGFSFLPIVLPQFFSKMIKKSSEVSSEANENFIREVNENLRAISTIKHYQRSSYFLERFIKSLNKAEQSCYRLGLIRNWINLVLGVAGGVAGLLPFALGGWLAVEGKVSVGGLVAVFLASDRVLSPLENALNYWNNINAAKPIKYKVERYLEKNSLPPRSTGKKRAVNQFSFENSAIGHEQPLYTLNAKVKKNDKILLMGESGAGKSSLFETIFREIDPISGTIRLDNCVLGEFSQDDLYATIGYIPQEIVLFDDTLRFNVTLGEEFLEDELISALKRVGLGELVMKRGLDFSVGNNGEELSGGERARLAIARVLIRQYNILLVDEFSASLDKKIAEHIRKMLLEMDITLIEIAHHYSESDKMLYNQVWELRNGQVVIESMTKV